MDTDAHGCLVIDMILHFQLRTGFVFASGGEWLRAAVRVWSRRQNQTFCGSVPCASLARMPGAGFTLGFKEVSVRVICMSERITVNPDTYDSH
jgi:hypothetical protein